MNRLTDGELRSLLELDEKGTEGPWEWVRHDHSMLGLESAPRSERSVDPTVLYITRCESCQKSDEVKFPCGWPDGKDAALIAGARNALRSLVEELLQRRAEDKFYDGTIY